MLFGHCPFGDCNIKQLVSIYSGQKMKVDIPGDKILLTPIAESMLRRMLEKDQFKRISW